MDEEKLSKLAESALAPYIDTINQEREQTKFWYEQSIKVGEQYLELMKENSKLRDEIRQLYMKLLDIKD